MSTAVKVTMSDAQFNRLRKIVYERAGIHFQDSKKYVLESRLTHRLHELEIEDYDQYISFLSFGPYKEDEFQEMFNRITINETSFFRNEPQLEVFESQILPQVLEARKDTKRLRIWSAACSSGEEPYTLAILVHRTLGVRLPDWHIEILGTDISEKVLEVAQTGQFTNYAVRNTPHLVQNRYFKQQDGFYHLNKDIMSMVNFEQLNLKDSLKAKRHGTWDVIFCRNVLIYFDDEMKQNCVNIFNQQLNSDGYLFIGHSESLRGMESMFGALPIPHAFCYRKISAL